MSMPAKTPASAPERDHLIAQRKRDLPRPSPAPAPVGMGSGNDPAINRARHLAHQREGRIQEINKALHKEKGAARRAFSRER